jgi:ATP synthase protein I
MRSDRLLPLLQIAITLVVAGVCMLTGGSGSAGAALYGGGVTVFNTVLMARSVDRATRGGMVWVYLGSVQRFAFALAALALGMGYLKLEPLPLVLAFGAAYLGHVALAGLQRFLTD